MGELIIMNVNFYSVGLVCGSATTLGALLQPPVRRMPVRKAVIDCLCFLLFFFIKRVIFETAESTLAQNMAERRAWLGRSCP